MTYHGLDICHRMVQTGTNNPHKLTTRIDGCRVWPLVIAPIPLLCASLHLSHIIGSQGQALETTMHSHQSRGNKVIEGKTIKGMESTPWTLNSLIDHLSQRVGPVQIITSGSGILDVVPHLELLEALCLGVINILGIGNELRRRRSVGSRHFIWRMGQWCKTQWLMLLLAAHVRHGLIWSSLPLPWSPSVCRPDKPRIFFIHSYPTSFGMWCYFYLHLTHHCSIFVAPLSSNPPLSPITPLFVLVNPPILCNSEPPYSFYFYPPYVHYWVMVCAQDLPKHVCI